MEELSSSSVLELSVAAIAVLYALWWFLRSGDEEKKLPPGPSGLPMVGHLHLLGTLPHQSLSKLSRKHGPIMMINLGTSPSVVVSSAEAAQEFLTTHDLVFGSRPKLMAPKHLIYNSRDVAWSEYGPYWRQMRKICTLELFTPKRMEESKGIRSDELSLLLKSIVDEGHEGKVAVDMNAKLSIVSMNVITRMAFGKTLFGTSDTSLGNFLGLIQELLNLIGAFNVGDYVPFLSWLDPQGYIPRMKSVHTQLDKVFQKLIEEHRASQGPGTPDLLDVLLSLEGVDDDSIKAIVLDMISAGTDTSSITTEWAMSELINNPTCLLKAQEEMDRVIGRGCLVTEADLHKLKYLSAIVKETFRLHPPVPLLLPHESTQESKVKGYTIPKKCRLMVNVWSIARDPSSWDSPEEFNPERFNGSSVEVKGRHFELIPFGSGRRMCPGMSLGLCMVELMLAHMVQGFEWRVNEEQLDMEEEAGLTMRRKVPLNAFATPRLPLHLYN